MHCTWIFHTMKAHIRFTDPTHIGVLVIAIANPINIRAILRGINIGRCHWRRNHDVIHLISRYYSPCHIVINNLCHRIRTTASCDAVIGLLVNQKNVNSKRWKKCSLNRVNRESLHFLQLASHCIYFYIIQITSNSVTSKIGRWKCYVLCQRLKIAAASLKKT